LAWPWFWALFRFCTNVFSLKEKRMRPERIGLLLCLLILFSTTFTAHADEQWRTRAHVDVAAPGIIEAVLPPALVNGHGPNRLDLSLAGPDGLPRAFELYWREPVGDVRLALEPDTLMLDQDKRLIWEARLPDNVIVRSLHITLDRKNAVGRIDVHGLIDHQWIALVSNAAVFTAGSPGRGSIELPEKHYDRLRLYLRGYDRKAHQTLSPLSSVVVEGRRGGRDFAVQTMDLAFEHSRSGQAHIIEAVLPGNSLYLETLEIKTEARFQGRWQVGAERIAGGAKTFEALLTGRQDKLDGEANSLSIPIGRQWPGRSLVVKLEAGDRYIGKVAAVSARFRLPRLIFSAEKAGRFTAVSGTGKSVPEPAPADTYRQTDATLAFSTPETNARYGLASLVERFQLKGGPFNPQGYAWRAPVTIPAPGYYRLLLDMQAGLQPDRSKIRLVYQNTQVPFILGRFENRTVVLEGRSTYDAGKNESFIDIQLPQASPYWQELTLQAAGIFKRSLRVEIPQPGAGRRQVWRTLEWQNRDLRKTALHLSLTGLPQGIRDLRLIILHGDNQPVTISTITATYTTPSIYFLAYAAGPYSLYGGSPQARQPSYDLSLIQSELFNALPEQAEMGPPEPLKRPGWWPVFKSAFKDTGWGLYAVLGLVTVVLLVIIVRLFPKPAGRETDGK
jgi:hypothetical protein